MTQHLNAEAGARTLFDRTFQGTLFHAWEEQPEAFKAHFRETAEAVALACQPGSTLTLAIDDGIHVGDAFDDASSSRVGEPLEDTP